MKKDFSFDFSGKIILITGSSKGIGAGIAKCFAEYGGRICIHYKDDLDNAKKTKEANERIGAETILLKADLRDPKQVNSMFDQIIKEWDIPDILVNNAGSYPSSSILEISEEDWDTVLETNLKSVFLCTKRFAQDLIQSKKSGSVVNIDSISSINPGRDHSHYSSAKAGVVMFTKTAAFEFGPYGIRVNSIGPGLINSPALETNWPDGVKRWLEKVPLGRLGKPEDISQACLFLASDASEWITGSHLIVDGGMLTNQIY